MKTCDLFSELSKEEFEKVKAEMIESAINVYKLLGISNTSIQV